MRKLSSVDAVEDLRRDCALSSAFLEIIEKRLRSDAIVSKSEVSEMNAVRRLALKVALFPILR